MHRLRLRDRQRALRPGAIPAFVAALIALALALPAAASATDPSFAVNLTGTGEGEVECNIKEPGEELEEGLFCDGIYPVNTQITVLPTAEEGSKFIGFENGTGSASAASCTGKKVSCSFTINANSSVDARFDLTLRTLAINITGEGEVECEVVFEGTVEVGSCEEEYPENAKITLEPVAEEGSEFAGFKNGTGSATVCTGKNTSCPFTITANSAVDAPFNPIPEYTLTVDVSGSGAVAGFPGLIRCGSVCSGTYRVGTVVTLAAAPSPGSFFAGWAGGGCKGIGKTCTVTLNGDTKVAAEFEPIPPPDPEEELLEVEAGTARAAGAALVKAGKATLKLTCSGGPCKGTLKLTAKVKQGKKAKTLVIGTASFKLSEDATKTLKVKLSAPAKRELGKGRTIKAKLSGTGIAASTVKLKPA